MNHASPATLGKLSLALLLGVALIGCTKKVKETPPADAGTGTTATTSGSTTTPIADTGATRPGAYTAADLDRDACLRTRVVYFDLDQDALKPEFQAAMSCHAKYLRDRPAARLRLEGNADERGSREYNLGLGERRGNAVSSALQANGASSGQLDVISYGEERPVCREPGEGCWAQNRRVELVYSTR